MRLWPSSGSASQADPAEEEHRTSRNGPTGDTGADVVAPGALAHEPLLLQDSLESLLDADGVGNVHANRTMAVTKILYSEEGS